jgi:hypothetical protein
MLNTKQMSPRTYSLKKEELEKWVKVQHDEMKETKKQFKKEWHKTTQIIEETQKNAEQMKKEMKVHIDNTLAHHVSSQHSSAQHQDSKRSKRGSFDQSEDPETSQGFLEKRWKKLSTDLKPQGTSSDVQVGPEVAPKRSSISKEQESSSALLMHASGRIGLPGDSDQQI